MAGGEDFNNFK